MKILLAEDSALLRAGLAQVLRAVGHEVVEVGDADELMERAESTAPDLVVTDVRMPPGMGDDGLRAAQALRERWLREGRGPLPVLVLSQYVAAGYLDRLLEHGGFGYLLKERVGDVDELIRTLEEVAGGGTVVDPEVVATLLGSRRRGVERLTPREREVLGLMAEGLSNAQIARRLVLSAAAVSKHVSGVFTKLGFLPEDENRRVRAVLIWLRRRGIRPGAPRREDAHSAPPRRRATRTSSPQHTAPQTAVPASSATRPDASSAPAVRSVCEPSVSARVTSDCGHALASAPPFRTRATPTTIPPKHTATGAAKDRMRMLSSDWTAMRGWAAGTAMRHSTAKLVGGTGPRPSAAPTSQVRTRTITCMRTTGAVMTRVLAAARAAGECVVVRIAVQLDPRCSGRQAAEPSSATPREKKNML